MKDEIFMRRCLYLARGGQAEARPNPMVGAVIVHDGRIIGEGYHIRCGEGHAEVNAFASVKAEDEHLIKDSTIYVSLEPCAHYGKTPPCAELIIRKGVRRAVVGCVDIFAKVQGRGIEMLRNTGIEVKVGVLENECKAMNKVFFTYHGKHRPYITLKWAQTANGYIDDNGNPLAISTPLTRLLAHKLRSENDAILIGRITEEREHPRLNVRHWAGRSPKKIVLSHDTDLRTLMDNVYDNGLQSLLVEGGAKTHYSFIDADLWDEIRVETSRQTVSNGTKAPSLPHNIKKLREVVYDGNTITTYVHA